MRILYLHQYFISRKGTHGTRSYEFSRYLTGRGHHVTMLASGIANEEFPTPPSQKSAVYDVEGIELITLAAGYNDSVYGTALNGWQRMLKFYQFAHLASKVGAGLEKPDVVFATHTPLTIGLAGMSLARHFKVPFVFEVRDLWPEALVNVGALNNPAAVWWLSRMARKIYTAADHIVALSPGMKEGICRTGVGDQKVTVIPNSSDLDLFNPNVDGSAARERLGLGDRFAAVYFGAMGHANGLDYAIEAARILARRKRDDIVIVLHGGGGKREQLVELARSYNLDNVVFSELLRDKSEVARIVAGCNACMTIYKAAREQTWSPNKMFDSFAAGRPVLINVGGWLGETVESNGCGICTHPTDPTSLADALEKLADDRQLCRQMGDNSRRLAETEFDRIKLAGKLETVLSDVTGC